MCVCWWVVLMCMFRTAARPAHSIETAGAWAATEGVWHPAVTSSSPAWEETWHALRSSHHPVTGRHGSQKLWATFGRVRWLVTRLFSRMRLLIDMYPIESILAFQLKLTGILFLFFFRGSQGICDIIACLVTGHRPGYCWYQGKISVCNSAANYVVKFKYILYCKLNLYYFQVTVFSFYSTISSI